MEMWQVWLLVKLDSISVFLEFTAFISTMLAGFGNLARCAGEKIPPSLGRMITGVTVYASLAVPAAVLLPTTKEAAVIIAVPAIMDSRVVKEDIPEVYDLAVEWAKEKLGKPANVEAP